MKTDAIADLLYLDYNATTPVDPRVADAMEPFLRTIFGNPSSSHAQGRAARAAVDRARDHAAALLGCPAAGLIFTSGGTEANNHAIIGATAAAFHGQQDVWRQPQELSVNSSTVPYRPEYLAGWRAEEWQAREVRSVGPAGPPDSEARVDPMVAAVAAKASWKR